MSSSVAAYQVKRIEVIVETPEGKDMIITADGINTLELSTQYDNLYGHFGFDENVRYDPRLRSVNLSATLYPDKEGNCFTMQIVEMDLFGRDKRFPSDGGDPVHASVPGYDKIPVEDERVAFIGLGDLLTYAKTVEEKRAMVFDTGFTAILIAWPGKYSQDVFLVDDLDALRRRLGFSLKGDNVKVDTEGRKWKLDE